MKEGTPVTVTIKQRNIVFEADKGGAEGGQPILPAQPTGVRQADQRADQGTQHPKPPAWSEHKILPESTLDIIDVFGN